MCTERVSQNVLEAVLLELPRLDLFLWAVRFWSHDGANAAFKASKENQVAGKCSCGDSALLCSGRGSWAFDSLAGSVALLPLVGSQLIVEPKAKKCLASVSHLRPALQGGHSSCLMATDPEVLKFASGCRVTSIRHRAWSCQSRQFCAPYAPLQTPRSVMCVTSSLSAGRWERKHATLQATKKCRLAACVPRVLGRLVVSTCSLSSGRQSQGWLVCKRCRSP